MLVEIQQICNLVFLWFTPGFFSAYAFGWAFDWPLMQRKDVQCIMGVLFGPTLAIAFLFSCIMALILQKPKATTGKP